MSSFSINFVCIQFQKHQSTQYIKLYFRNLHVPHSLLVDGVYKKHKLYLRLLKVNDLFLQVLRALLQTTYLNSETLMGSVGVRYNATTPFSHGQHPLCLLYNFQ